MPLCECGCGKECKNRFIHGHNILGKNNPNPKKTHTQKECECGCEKLASPGKRFISGHNSNVHSPFSDPTFDVWNKGLTKENDKRILAISKKTSKILTGRTIPREVVEKIRSKNLGQKRTGVVLENLRKNAASLEYRQTLSKALKGRKFSLQHIENMKKTSQRPEIIEKKFRNSGKRKFAYLSKLGQITKMRSNWEIQYAQKLDKEGIVWQYEPKKFKTEYGWYFPDFYLPDSNEYHEVKGYLTEKARRKINSFTSLFPEVTFKMIGREHIFEVV